MFRKTSIFLVLMLATSGCISQSDIQADYVAQQDDCRGRRPISLSWNSLFGSESAPPPPTVTVAQFSECMNKAGWRVATPKPGQVATGPAPNPPTGSPSTNPSAATAAVATPQPPTQQVPAENPRPVAQAPNPPTGSPSVNPSAAARTAAPKATPQPSLTTPPLATYQPARPQTVPAPAYGQGAGRKF